jgi:hypothetical protein
VYDTLSVTLHKCACVKNKVEAINVYSELVISNCKPKHMSWQSQTAFELEGYIKNSNNPPESRFETPSLTRFFWCHSSRRRYKQNEIFARLIFFRSIYPLCKYAEVDNGQTHCVPSCVLANTECYSRIVGAARSSRSGWQRAIQNQRRRTVDIRNIDDGFVQVVIAAVADQILQVLLVVVLVTAARAVLFAQTRNRQ